eukprot:TRINITY_DN13146_c0_g1_i3.p1 TRINITY_DN13146_c0_g1~~TRINITY_DN13146_c0_g1_i3.p1  ORF type:complete len:181 (-),score=60.70 TRINITY_DN13146_c0_g1_i3:43-585(-)
MLQVFLKRVQGDKKGLYQETKQLRQLIRDTNLQSEQRADMLQKARERIEEGKAELSVLRTSCKSLKEEVEEERLQASLLRMQPGRDSQAAFLMDEVQEAPPADFAASGSLDAEGAELILKNLLLQRRMRGLAEWKLQATSERAQHELREEAFKAKTLDLELHSEAERAIKAEALTLWLAE